MDPEDRQHECGSHPPARWLIATFSPITKWDGRTITYDGAVFTLEQDGRLEARAVQEYGRQGFLLWASPDTYSLVEQAAARELSAERELTTARELAPSASDPELALTAPGPTGAPQGRRLSAGRGRSIAAALSIVALVVAILLVAGVFRLHTPSIGGATSRTGTTAGALSTPKPTVRVSTNWAGYVATGGRRPRPARAPRSSSRHATTATASRRSGPSASWTAGSTAVP